MARGSEEKWGAARGATRAAGAPSGDDSRPRRPGRRTARLVGRTVFALTLTGLGLSIEPVREGQPLAQKPAIPWIFELDAPGASPSERGRVGPNDNEPLLAGTDGRTGPNDNEPLLADAAGRTGPNDNEPLLVEEPPRTDGRVVVEPDSAGRVRLSLTTDCVETATLILRAEGAEILATPLGGDAGHCVVDPATGLLRVSFDLDLESVARRLGVRDLLDPDVNRLRVEATLRDSASGAILGRDSWQAALVDLPWLEFEGPSSDEGTVTASPLPRVCARLRPRSDDVYYLVLGSGTRGDLRVPSRHLFDALERSTLLGGGSLSAGPRCEVVLDLDTPSQNPDAPDHVVVWTLSAHAGWARSRIYTLR